MRGLWARRPSGVRAVALVTAASPCHLYKADRGCAGSSLTVSLACSYRADLFVINMG